MLRRGRIVGNNNATIFQGGPHSLNSAWVGAISRPRVRTRQEMRTAHVFSPSLTLSLQDVPEWKSGRLKLECGAIKPEREKEV